MGWEALLSWSSSSLWVKKAIDVISPAASSLGRNGSQPPLEKKE
jgi:hypothetical protein